MDFFVSPAFAADNSTVTTGGVDSVAVTDAVPYELSPEKAMFDNFLILGALFFIFYFVLIKPQQKRIKLHKEMVESLQKGSKVITSGGIIGTIIKLESDDIVLVEIAQGVQVRVAKSSISEVVGDKLGKGANDN